MRRPPSRAFYQQHLGGGPGCGCSTPGLSGVGDDIMNFFGDASKNLVGSVQDTGAKLQRALTTITILSGIAAAGTLLALYGAVRRR